MFIINEMNSDTNRQTTSVCLQNLQTKLTDPRAEPGYVQTAITSGSGWSPAYDDEIRLMTVVEVIPLVAGAAPVIVGSGVVGAVVGVLGLLVQSAGLGVLDESLGVQVGRLLAVEDGAHCCKEASIRT